MRLVDDARNWWRWWSVQVSALTAIAVGWAMASPQQVLGLVTYVPEFWRPAVGALVGLCLFSLHSGARVTQQGGKANG